MSYAKLVYTLNYLNAGAAAANTTNYPKFDQPPAGTTLTVKYPVAAILDAASVPPVTFYPQPIVCTFDTDGNLLDPAGNVGVWIIDPRNASLQPHGYTLNATLAFPGQGTPVTFAVGLNSAGADGSFDISLNSPVPPASGSTITVGTQGPPGPGVSVKGTVANFAALPASPVNGDAWEALDTGHMWVWNATSGLWVDMGAWSSTNFTPPAGTANGMLAVAESNSVAWQAPAAAGVLPSTNPVVVVGNSDTVAPLGPNLAAGQWTYSGSASASGTTGILFSAGTGTASTSVTIPSPAASHYLLVWTYTAGVEDPVSVTLGSTSFPASATGGVVVSGATAGTQTLTVALSPGVGQSTTITFPTLQALIGVIPSALTVETVSGQVLTQISSVGNTNTGFGASALQNINGGYMNVAVGYHAMASEITGHENVAVGRSALYYNVSGQSNVAVGYEALLSSVQDSYNTAVGYNAAMSVNGASGIVAVGSYSLYSNVTGSGSTAVGDGAFENGSNITNGTAVGNSAGRVASGADNTLIGNYAGMNPAGPNPGSLLAGINNVFVGSTSGVVGTNDPSNAVAVGYAAHADTSGIAIGANATANGQSVAIGAGAVSQPGQVVLGTSPSVVIIPGIPTADPHVAGALWSNAGVVNVSAG